MANFTSTIEYKFKVTNNLDKPNAQQKKFNFYLGLPYSKRKYRHMQVINFATNKEGQHLFNVVLGHSESSVAAMTEDILRGTHASLKPVSTKVMRITYASVNVGQVAFLCNASNKEVFERADWTGISGEYTKIKSFRTNGNDEVIGLIFDAADRSAVAARKNDSTNVVAKPETPDVNTDEVKPDPELLWKAHQKLLTDYEVLEKKAKELEFYNGCFKRDLDVRDKDVEQLCEEVNKLRAQLKETKPDETEKTFRQKFIDKIVDGFREKLQSLTDDELLPKGDVVHYDIWY